MNTPALRLLMILFLGLPAAILWAAGILGVVGGSTILWMGPGPGRMLTMALAGCLGGVAAASFGWLVLIVVNILSGGDGYRVPPKRLAACAALEIAVSLLYAQTASTLIAAGVRSDQGPAQASGAWLPAVLVLPFFLAALWVQKHANARRRRWEEELRSSLDPR